MPTYKLIYFKAKGTAEILRFIFAQAGVTYEDKRIGREADWPALKPTTPTGQLPILEVDGKVLTGSRPIAKLLAERFGLAGSNDVENAQIGGIIDYIFDCVVKLYPWFEAKDEEKKAVQEDLVKEQFPKYWGTVNKWIEENKSDESWVFGNKPTYADFIICCYTDFMMMVDPEFLSKYPAVGKNKAAVAALPNIAKWIKERPETKY